MTYSKKLIFLCISLLIVSGGIMTQCKSNTMNTANTKNSTATATTSTTTTTVTPDNTADNTTQTNVFLMSKELETKITVKVAQDFFIKIESNITTGYSWSVKKNKSLEDKQVTFLGKRDQREDEANGREVMMGAPGFEIFSFKANTLGNAVIELEYRRPWEKDTKPDKTHKVLVTIQ